MTGKVSLCALDLFRPFTSSLRCRKTNSRQRRSNKFSGQRSAAGPGCPEKSPMRASGIRFPDWGKKGRNIGKAAVNLAILLLLLVLMSGRPALAATEIHGADSSFRAQGVTILWAILKGASEENSFVHIRILHDRVTAPGLGFYRIEAVDPFSKEREWVMQGEPLKALQTWKIVRTDFRDKTERWLHFYPDRESLEKGRPALTIFYHGVPDTAPELRSEAELEAYLAEVPSRIK
jgi:hypothetical protein